MIGSPELCHGPEASLARRGSSDAKVRQRQACEILKRGHRCGEGVTDIPMSEVKVSVWRVQCGVGVEVKSAALGPRLPGPNSARPRPSCVTKQTPNFSVLSCSICEMREMIAPTHGAAMWMKSCNTCTDLRAGQVSS